MGGKQVNAASLVMLVTVIWFLLGATCQRVTPVRIALTIPPRLDMAGFTGLYFPGFAINDDEANAVLVRALQREFRTRGYAVVQGELTNFRVYQRRFPWDNFSGQTALVISGQLDVQALDDKGFRTRTRELFDPFGRRSVEEQRRYEERSGFVLSGLLVFIDRGRPVLRVTGIRAATLESVAWSETQEVALVGFVASDLSPVILRIIAPSATDAPRMLIR